MPGHKCGFCKCSCSTYKGYLNHLQWHETIKNFKVLCAFEHCISEFTSVRVHKRHLRKKHHVFFRGDGEVHELVHADMTLNNDDDGLPVETFLNNEQDPTAMHDGNHQPVDQNLTVDQHNIEHNMRHKLGSLLLGLREHNNMTSKAVCDVSHNLVDVAELAYLECNDKIRQYFESQGANVPDELMEQFESESEVTKEIRQFCKK